ncbi:MAG: GntR family transcriptional regulator [Planctomycetes bacterium]|nr:GntR family transcriptional regulator [Planctomycetota bacterium]
MGLDRDPPVIRKGVHDSASARATAFLHQRIAEALRSRMSSGVFAGGSKLPSLKEIAAEFDVSTMTVRRAIATLEREGHIHRLPRVGVFMRPDGPGRRMNSATLAFVATGLESPFQMAVANSTQRTCQRHGGAILVLDGHLDAELEMSHITRLPSSGVAGAVILPPFRHPKAVQALQHLNATGFPMVVLDMTLPGVHADFVASDHEAGAYRATAHFLERGHSGVFFLTLTPYSSSVLARVQGYERALLEYGKSPLPEWKVWIDLDEHVAGFERGRKWWGSYKAILPVLKGRRLPLAVLAIDAYAGWGVYEACRELNLRIPEDVSVVAFDETEIAHTMRPPMTVVAQRCDELGRSAVELLRRRLETGRVEAGPRKTLTQVVVDVDLIERESVANLAKASATR